MAVVVSDTSPLNYLVLIEAIDVLSNLYGQVLIPSAVWSELAQPETPPIVLNWLARGPSWLEVAGVTSPDHTLSHLDEGEAHAIALALERKADLLLIDERDGAAAARARGLTVTGTLGVLNSAARLEVVDLPAMFARLSRTTFRTPVRLMSIMLEQDALRRQRQRPAQF